MLLRYLKSLIYNSVAELRRNTYGITAGYDFTDRLEMEVGIQNYYNPEKGWNVAPIVIPRYKFKKFDIGIDVGGLLYETIRK